VERIYGLVGDSLNPIVDAVRRTDGIEWIHVRNEEAAAFAAAAEAQLTGRLAVCAGSCGPGNTHLIQGLYDAHRTGAPVLALASHITSKQIGTGFFQETHPERVFTDCSDYCEMVATPAQMPRVLRIAMQRALGHGAVSVLVLPGDLADAQAPNPTVTGDLVTDFGRVVPPPAQVQALVTKLNAAEKVMLFCGAGVREAHTEVMQLAGKVHSPVGHSLRGKEWIQYDNPYDVGMSGLLGYGACYEAMHECDLLVLLGTDFPYVQFMPTKPKVVQVDVARERLGRRSRLDLGVWGDARETVLALLPRVAEKTDRSFLDRTLRRHRELMERAYAYARGVEGRRPIHPEQVAATLHEVAADDAIFTVDTGMCNVWAARFIHAMTPGRRFLGSFNHGTMANALPQSIGAQLPDRGRQVVAICGDGGFTMLMGEFLTLLQYDLPVKVVIFDNSSLAMVELEMLVAGLPPYQTDLKNPDFAAVARAAGATGIRIEDPGDVRDGLREALATPGPVLVDTVTDPNALSMPPKVTPGQVKGFALAFSKIVLSGDADAALEMARSNVRNLPRP
jgi:pyruvate dehydrogenase (quinone)